VCVLPSVIVETHTPDHELFPSGSTVQPIQTISPRLLLSDMPPSEPLVEKDHHHRFPSTRLPSALYGRLHQSTFPIRDVNTRSRSTSLPLEDGRLAASFHRRTGRSWPRAQDGKHHHRPPLPEGIHGRCRKGQSPGPRHSHMARQRRPLMKDTRDWVRVIME
jgi:hypothetical protein